MSTTKSAVPPDESDGPLSGVAYHLGDMVSPFVPFAEPLAVQDQHFVDCIINNSAPLVNGSSGLAVVQALECAQISLREQRPVALAEVAQRQAGRGPRWTRRSPGHPLADPADAAVDSGSEEASGMTSVPFTDLAAMASEVWPEIRAGLPGLPPRRKRTSAVPRSRPSSESGPPTAARIMRWVSPTERTPCSSA